jgi:hypothetical protein
MAERIVSGLAALSMALAPAVMKFAERDRAEEAEPDAKAEVQCVGRARRRRCTSDFSASLTLSIA